MCIKNAILNHGSLKWWDGAIADEREALTNIVLLSRLSKGSTEV